jgi:MarR-like DNA-binding transcriptional regulator SgrR of sgrS sRNA
MIPARVALRAFVLVLSPLGLWAAVGPRYGGALRVGVLDLGSAPDPDSSRGTGTRLFLALCHETLVRAGPDGVTPSLAARWTSRAEGREWVLELAEGLRFHDGRALTSEDAVRSLRRFLRSASPAASLLAQELDGGLPFRSGKTTELPGALADAPNLVVLRFVNPQAALPAMLASPAAVVMSSNGRGSGPFSLAQAMGDQRAILVAFDQHVRGRPYLDQLEMVRFESRDALRHAREQGTVNVALGEQGTGPLAGRLLLLLDPESPAFRKPQARARVAAAIDRDILARRYLPGSEAACGLLGEVLLPPGLRCAVPTSRAATSSSAPAGGRTPLTLVVDDAVPAAASQRVVAHLLALGYRPTAQAVPADRVTRTEADARLFVWTAEIDDPLCALHELAVLAGLGAGGTRLEEALDSPVPTARLALLAASERAILDTHTVIPLAATSVFALGGTRVMGVTVSPGGRLLLEESWLPL